MSLLTDLDRKTNKGAMFSPCKRYRYMLWRSWNTKPKLVWIMLNPSTADQRVDDPTIRRCISFAYNFGYGGIYILNLFAFRATSPKQMKMEADPVGPENDEWLLNYKKHDILLAWGNHGKFMDRDQKALEILKGARLFCLKLTGDQQPAHPLYLSKSLIMIPFSNGAINESN